MHCRLCKEYIEETDDCNLCMFELDESKFFSKSKFDILDLKEEDGWEHMQIIDRLHSCDVECLWADIWYDNNELINTRKEAPCISI